MIRVNSPHTALYVAEVVGGMVEMMENLKLNKIIYNAFVTN